MRGLAGRSAIVTGAARGIGLAIARRLAEEGVRVLLADRDPLVEAVARELGQHHAVADVSRAEAVAALFGAADAALGDLDILVNNVGVIHPAGLMETTPEDFDRVMGINVRAAFLTTQAAARRMIPSGSGAIVNITSMAAVLASASAITYTVSKAALKQLTAASALNLAAHGIRVNAVGPGTIETEMAQLVTSGDGLQRVLSRTPLGRLGQVHEIAAAVAFLASDEASYITGQTLYADGGRLPLAYFAEPRAAQAAAAQPNAGP